MSMEQLMRKKKGREERPTRLGGCNLLNKCCVCNVNKSTQRNIRAKSSRLNGIRGCDYEIMYVCTFLRYSIICEIEILGNSEQTSKQTKSLPPFTLTSLILFIISTEFVTKKLSNLTGKFFNSFFNHFHNRYVGESIADTTGLIGLLIMIYIKIHDPDKSVRPVVSAIDSPQKFISFLYAYDFMNGLQNIFRSFGCVLLQ